MRWLGEKMMRHKIAVREKQIHKWGPCSGKSEI